ncbi:MAG TPA: family 20 glycosylhydrolase, partial [Opitutales bacterium]|nr:family 20 glycosylhydrolase [Opitutales bacterium]
GIAITASTAEGVFYGIQTLSQLIRPSVVGAFYHSALIEDWPTMEFRGAHWFPSASGVSFHGKLIKRIMAQFKMNSAVIQCEAAVWDRHPEIAGPNSISKSALADLVTIARQNFIDPIPLINVPGHAEWIFRNNQNRHFAEDPSVAYAYCVNHPDSWAFIEDIFEETIEVFQPERFHLGHDEVTMRGQFPHSDCPRCVGETATDLVLKHLDRTTAWFRERGIETMIWGDMMLSRDEIPDMAAFAPNLEEAQIRRTNLPEGITITDWHYYREKEYPSLGYFHDAGHPTIASTWYVPNNIYHFAHAALENQSRGLLQTTWAGFFPDEQVLKNALHQFTAFILAAEYAWSGNDALPTDLPFEPGRVFLDSYYRSSDKELSGYLVDLSEMAETPREEWLGVENGWDFAALGSGKMRLDEVLFEVPQNLLLVGGRMAPESALKKVEIEIGEKAKTLALLNTTLFDAPQKSIPVRMTVVFADGSEIETPFIQGRETHHWKSEVPALSAAVGWRTESPFGTPMVFRVSRWENPHPEKTIRKIIFDHAAAEQAWALLGMTLLGE